MKKNFKFYNQQFGFVYSTGVLYTSNLLHTYLFLYVLDAFNTEI